MAKLSYIEGIGEVYQQKLENAGIHSVNELYKACLTKKDRAALAEKAGIDEALILRWANHCDLFRVKGVGSEYADLLEMAGVDTVPELAGRKPENLYAKMQEINAEKKLVRRLPTAAQVEDWVRQAKELPRMLQY